MEALKIKQNQRYAYKLNEEQNSKMIDFAVEPPRARMQAIQLGSTMLDHGRNPILKHFGINVDESMAVVDGRLIAPPVVRFDKGEATPSTSGQWELKGKGFLKTNTTPLKSWAVCTVASRRGSKPDKDAVQRCITEFVKGYQGHGGKVENKQPAMSVAQGHDVGAWVTAAWNAAGNQVQSRPQLLVFILPDTNATTYGRIKRSAECRYGVVSQCMQYAHVRRRAPQYISNVCMKVNAKLGGSTARAVGAKTGGATGIFTEPTVIIGADVSHGAPGTQSPSIAAMTMSMDKLGIRYAAACETNGYRVEMITTDNINSMMKPLLQNWTQSVGELFEELPSRLAQRLIFA